MIKPAPMHQPTRQTTNFWVNKHNSCEKKGHINRFSECCALKKISSESAFSGRTLPTLTFLYFYFFFVSKCIPRNQLNQAETQNSNERQIAVGASKPNLVDFIFWKCLKQCEVELKSSATKIGNLCWVKRLATIETVSKTKEGEEKERKRQT